MESVGKIIKYLEDELDLKFCMKESELFYETIYKMLENIKEDSFAKIKENIKTIKPNILTKLDDEDKVNDFIITDLAKQPYICSKLNITELLNKINKASVLQDKVKKEKSYFLSEESLKDDLESTFLEK